MRSALNIVNLALIAVLCLAAVSVHGQADAPRPGPILPQLHQDSD